MRTMSRILIIISLLIGFALPALFYAQAEQAIIEVTPNTGEVGIAVFEVHVTGLESGETYSVEFVFKGAVVSESDEVADENGEITFTGGSQEDDEVGTYTVQVVDEVSVIASTQFILTAANDDTSSENETDDTSTKSTGTMSIEPSNGAIGTVHHISVSNLAPNANYTVEIMSDADEKLIYRRIWKSSATGALAIDIFAQEGDTPGTQSVTVYDNADNSIVAQSHFTVDAPLERNPLVIISPTSATAGTEFSIEIEGLAQFDNVSARITSQANELIDTLTTIARSNGKAILRFRDSAELADGTYTVTILVNDKNTASGTFTIGDTTIPIMSIEPQSAARGGRHTVSLSDLNPNQAFTLIVKNSDGEVEYTTERSADEDGEFSMNITSSESDEVGTYDVAIMDGEQALASATFTIEEETLVAQGDTPTVSVSPESGAGGDSFTISLSAMPAEARIGIVIRAESDNSLLYSGIVEIDENGSGILEYLASANARPDTYTVAISQANQRLAQATLIIEGAIATVDPLSAPKGSSFEVSVTGLNAKEAITFEVQFNGEVVYSSDKTADEAGQVSLDLKTETSDEIGDYTVNVIRAEGNQASVILTVTEPESEDTSTTENETTETSTATETDLPLAADSLIYEGSLNVDQTIDQFRFSGNEGDYVIMTLESEDFDPVLSLLDNNLLELAYSDDFNGFNPQIGPYRLPYSGDYIANIDQVGDFAAVTPGDFVLRVRYITLSAIEFGEDVSFTLNSETPAIYYEFSANAGEMIDVDVSTDGTIDTMLSIIGSEGYAIVSDDDSGKGLDPEFAEYIFDNAGSYILTISTFEADVQGEGTLTLIHHPAKSLDQGAQTIRLNDKQSRDYVVFEGVQGDVISLQIHRISGMVADLTISAFVNEIEIASYSTTGIADEFPLVFVMPMDGQVLLKFEEYSYQDGISFEVSLEK